MQSAKLDAELYFKKIIERRNSITSNDVDVKQRFKSSLALGFKIN